MKYLKYTLVLAVFVSSKMMAQDETPTKNYVKNTTYQVETTDGNVATDDKIETITYYDGLGRPQQTRAKQAGGNKEDIITPIVYDGFGRQILQYLPNADSGASSLYFITPVTLISDVESYYISNFPDDINSGTPNPYSESAYDGSPLNRVLQQAAPGEDWAIGSGHEIDFEYGTNATLEIQHFIVNLSFANDTYTPALALSGSYAENELIKVTVKDENHDGTTAKDHTTEEFKDKAGRVILKRTYNNEVIHETYYVYDAYGNLTYVLPPESNPHLGVPSLDELCYQYVYDVRNRLAEKKIPGKGWEYIVYNFIDQPVLTQDQNLKASDDWVFTKYDAHGRITYTGIMTSTSSRTSLQTTLDAETILFEKSGSITIDDINTFYTNDAYPQNNIDELHTIHYYDDYNFDNLWLNPPGSNVIYGESITADVTGLPTGSKTKVLGVSPNRWITAVSYYDEKARPIYSRTYYHHEDYHDQTFTEYNFIGNVKRVKNQLRYKTNSNIGGEEDFTYDHAGRVDRHRHRVIEGRTYKPWEVLSVSEYDGLGQLITKDIGNTEATPLQTVNYTYNVRGWLKQINDVDNLGSVDLFAFELKYNTPDFSPGTRGLYNGNISEAHWVTANDNINRNYRYQYDDLNRIIEAINVSDITNENSRYQVKDIIYDKNGNINTLTRNGWQNSGLYGSMDVLDYDYTGNQLIKVKDTGNTSYGFIDGVDEAEEYTYDNNGNMITDDNKGITTITYNHLNLPTQVTLSNGNIQYIYDALGIKLRKVVNETGQSSVSTNYAGNFVYDNDVLTFFNTAEGYIEPAGAGVYEYTYQYKDHLGNIRLSYKNIGTTSIPDWQIQEENNYYPFGLKHKGYNYVINGTDHKYGFGGMEEQDDNVGGSQLNWLDFGARNYDASLGRWMNLDPLAEMMTRHSPYNYAFDNPVFFIDPDGMKPRKNIIQSTSTGNIKPVRMFAHYHKRKKKGILDLSTKTYTGVHWIPNSGISTKGVSVELSKMVNENSIITNIISEFSAPEFTNSVSSEVKTITGQYFNSDGEAVSDIGEASSYSVTANTETTTFDTGVTGKLPEQGTLTVESTTTTYDITGGSGSSKYGGKQLTNAKTTVGEPSLSTINFDNAGSKLQNSVKDAVDDNFKQAVLAGAKILENISKSIEKSIEQN